MFNYIILYPLYIKHCIKILFMMNYISGAALFGYYCPVTIYDTFFQIYPANAP